jgi:ADP-glucose pyrophosphorylase
MTTELERYLNAATRGLWGKKKLEVYEELEAHVLERALKHELLGLAREVAISKSIQELGNARVINQRMMEVYMFSKQLLLGGFAACALAGITYWQVTQPRELRVQCANAAQTFRFSGVAIGTIAQYWDASGVAVALQENTDMQAKAIDIRVSDDPENTFEMEATSATIGSSNQQFFFKNVTLKTPAEPGSIRCSIL